VVLSWFADRPQTAGEAVCLGIAARIGRLLLAGDPRRAHADSGGRRALHRGRARAVALAAEGEGRDGVLNFRTNVEDEVPAGPVHPIRVTHNPETGEPSPYILVREGLEALIARPVYYELVSLGREEMVNGTMMFGVWSGGRFFALGALDEGSAGRSDGGAGRPRWRR
jgi:hypothetical protein